MRIVIVGDSLVYFPLKYFKKSYSFLIKEILSKQGHDVIIIAKPDNHSRAQSHSSRIFYDIIQFNPKIVIIHLGINDCAPRLFTELDEFFLRLLPVWVKMKVIRFFSRKRFYFTKKFQKVHVNWFQFEKNYRKIIHEIKKNDAVPIILNICKPAEHHLKRSYNLLDNVKKYNKILDLIARDFNCIKIDLYSLIDKNPHFLSNDGIHLSKSGHRELSKILLQEIKKL